MTDLVVRRMSFQFDATVRFMWQPANPGSAAVRLLRMLRGLALSQTPYHDPADQPLPDWADTWMREYERGTDMTMFVGKG